jgi:hypothetical protein
MKLGGILVLVFGIVLIWLGLNGKLGVFLASFFVPSKVIISDKENEETDESFDVTSQTSIIGSGNVISGVFNPTGLVNNTMGNINY